MTIIYKIIVVACSVIGVFFLGEESGKRITEQKIHNEAVQVGTGEWIADEDGSPKFQWKYQDKETE